MMEGKRIGGQMTKQQMEKVNVARTKQETVQGDRYLRPGRQQTLRPKAVIGSIISGFRAKRTYLF